MPEDPRFLPPTPFQRLVSTHAASVCADACVAASLAGSLFFAQPTNAARGDILLFLLLVLLCYVNRVWGDGGQSAAWVDSQQLLL